MSSGGLFVSRTISISTVFRGSSVGSVGRIPSMSLRILETRRRWRITSSRHREAVTVMAGVSVIRAGSSDRPETTGHPIRVALRSGQTIGNPVMNILRHPTYVRNVSRGRIPCLKTDKRTGGGECQETRKNTHPGIGKVGPMEDGPGSPDLSKHINYFSGRQH